MGCPCEPPRAPPGSDSFPERRPPRKGNTLYVHGAELSPELLRAAFGPFGAIIDLSMDTPRKWVGPGGGAWFGWGQVGGVTGCGWGSVWVWLLLVGGAKGGWGVGGAKCGWSHRLWEGPNMGGAVRGVAKVGGAHYCGCGRERGVAIDCGRVLP